MFYIILLILHLICCVCSFIAIEMGILNVHKYMFFVILCLPFWGIVLTLILHFRIAHFKPGSSEIGVEKMKLDSEIYKSVTVEEKNVAASTIPIEEALLVNSARERRTIIMDVLNDNPKEYVEFLQKAGNNDDTEVVHYAVTALVEISKENDYKLQQLEQRYAANPDDFEILETYTEFLWSCLSQNLMQGQVEVMNRKLYSTLIQQKLEKKISKTDYVRLVQNEMKVQNYTAAGAALTEMEVFWPEAEEPILLKLEYLATLGRGDDIQKLLEETEQRQIYLSAKSKEAFAFWKG